MSLSSATPSFRPARAPAAFCNSASSLLNFWRTAMTMSRREFVQTTSYAALSTAVARLRCAGLRGKQPQLPLPSTSTKRSPHL